MSGSVAVLDQKFDALYKRLTHCQWCLQYTCLLSTWQYLTSLHVRRPSRPYPLWICILEAWYPQLQSKLPAEYGSKSKRPIINTEYLVNSRFSYDSCHTIQKYQYMHLFTKKQANNSLVATSYANTSRIRVQAQAKFTKHASTKQPYILNHTFCITILTKYESNLQAEHKWMHEFTQQ